MKREGDFDAGTKLKAWLSLPEPKTCEKCGGLLAGKKVDYDHRIPLWAGGDNSLRNCSVIHYKCHKEKTRSEAKARKKVYDQARFQAGIVRKKKVMPGSRNSKWKKKMDGTVEER